MKKTYEARRPIAHLLPHVGGVSAAARRQYWSASPWSAFRESFRQH